MSTRQNVEYIITATGMMMQRQITETVAGNFIPQLQAQALAQGILVPQVLPRLDLMFLPNNRILAAQRLTELPFNTDFVLDSTKKVVWAEFKSHAETVSMMVMWKTPADMHLFLMGHGPLYEYDQAEWQFYVVAVCEQSKKEDAAHKGVWILPLPNQYEDGRMCFNVQLYNPKNKIAGWQDTFTRALELLSTARWVADPLFHDWKHISAKKLFRWENKAGFKQLELPNDITHWTKCCRLVASTQTSNFFTQWSQAYAIKL